MNFKIFQVFSINPRFRMYNDSSFDHSMAPANEDFRINLKDLTEENRKKVKALRDGAKTIRRAPPPSIRNTEERVSL